jgi:hypothetical protein
MFVSLQENYYQVDGGPLAQRIKILGIFIRRSRHPASGEAYKLTVGRKEIVTADKCCIFPQ